jgi:methionine-rich copper-binding protein CopC
MNDYPTLIGILAWFSSFLVVMLMLNLRKTTQALQFSYFEVTKHYLCLSVNKTKPHTLFLNFSNPINVQTLFITIFNPNTHLVKYMPKP